MRIAVRNIAVVVGIFCAMTAGNALAGTVTVVPGGSTVAGKSIGEWTAAWWNWAGSIAGPDSPLSDTTGAFANKNQSGPVFFVTGVGGPAGGTASRSFAVPTDKYILFPLENLLVFNGPDPNFSDTRAEVNAYASHAVDASKLFTEIDGQAVPNLSSHREASPLNFTFVGTPGTPIFPPGGTFNDANSDGFWLMLAPLGAGSHTLHFGGVTNEFMSQDGPQLLPGATIDVTANITAAPLPPALLPGAGLLLLCGAGMLIPRRFAARA